MNYKTTKDFNSLFLIKVIFKYWKFILFVLIIAVIFSVFFSSPLIIKPKYESTLIMFPSSSNSISKALLTERTDSKQDILEYGEDEQLDRMLQILNSNLIRDKIIEKYDLINHYNLSGASYKYTKLYSKYKKNIKFKRTQYMGICVRVLDENPQMAADIANDIGLFYDSACMFIQKNRAQQALKIVEAALASTTANIREMEDSLAVLRKLGVNDYESQSEVLNQQLAIELAKNNKHGVNAIQEKLDILALYGTPYVSLSNQLKQDKIQLSLLKSKYEEAKVDAEQVLTQKFVVSDAYKAEKKSYPIRWLIVLCSVIATFVFTLIIIILLEKRDLINNKIINS